jgi:hypothetical protein
MPFARVPAALRDRPFTTSEAASVGVSASALRGPQWRHVFRNVWAHKELPDDRATRFAAVRLVLPPDAFVCGLTAAWLYGIDVQDRRGDLVWIGCRRGHRLRTRPGCMVREITVAEADLHMVDGVLMTTPLRTVFDCGRWLTLVEAVVVADALAHADLTSPPELLGYYRNHRGLRGVRQLPQVIDLLEPKAESPMETRVRLLIVLSGLPRPDAQVIVVDRQRKFVARADLGYPEHRLLIEYDGAWHWEQLAADERRRDDMRRLGWDVLLVTGDDYYRNPARILERVRSALEIHSRA